MEIIEQSPTRVRKERLLKVIEICREWNGEYPALPSLDINEEAINSYTDKLRNEFQIQVSNEETRLYIIYNLLLDNKMKEYSDIGEVYIDDILFVYNIHKYIRMARKENKVITIQAGFLDDRNVALVSPELYEKLGLESR
jgi:hypothetical protein